MYERKGDGKIVNGDGDLLLFCDECGMSIWEDEFFGRAGCFCGNTSVDTLALNHLDGTFRKAGAYQPPDNGNEVEVYCAPTCLEDLTPGEWQA